MFGMSTGEIDPTIALSPQVYQMLKEAIVRTELQPGQRLSDIELAKTLDISRQPVREAFMRLQAEDVKTQMDRVRFLSFNHFHMKRLIRQHSDIVTAIANGQPVEAVEKMRHHLRGILESINLIAAEFPDFFTREHAESPVHPVLR